MDNKEDSEDASKKETKRIECVVRFVGSPSEKSLCKGERKHKKLRFGLKQNDGGSPQFCHLLCPCFSNNPQKHSKRGDIHKNIRTISHQNAGRRKVNLEQLSSQIKILDQKLAALESLYAVKRMESTIRETRMKRVRSEKEWKSHKIHRKEDKEGMPRERHTDETRQSHSNTKPEFIINCQVVRRTDSPNHRSEASSREPSPSQSGSVSAVSSQDQVQKVQELLRQRENKPMND